MIYSYMEEVCNLNNVIFKCNVVEDVFVVVEFVFYCMDGVVVQFNYVYFYFCVLILVRDDFYLIDYMCEFDFDLSLDQI